MVQLWGGAPYEDRREERHPVVFGGNKQLKLGVVLWLAITVVYVLLVFANGWSGLAKAWGSLLFPVSMTATAFIQARRWDRLNARRQAAARGDIRVASLAREQPVPNDALLLLPRSITVQPRRRQSALWLPVVGIFPLGYAIYWRITGDGSQWAATLIIIGVMLAAGLLGLIFSHPYEFTVTSHGLRAPSSNLERPWKEARLFAITGGKPATPATRYELAAENWSVEWRRLRGVRWYSSEEPELPFEEYDREMEALLLLIAAKTGLPLYDLR